MLSIFPTPPEALRVTQTTIKGLRTTAGDIFEVGVLGLSQAGYVAITGINLLSESINGGLQTEPFNYDVAKYSEPDENIQ